MPIKAAEYLDEKTLDGLNAKDPSNRALADGIKLILRKLWSEEDINELIDKRHKALCEKCTLRVSPVPVQIPSADEADAPVELTRRHVMIEVIKAPWFWLIVATVCAIVCYKVGISLPIVGGSS